MANRVIYFFQFPDYRWEEKMTSIYEHSQDSSTRWTAFTICVSYIRLMKSWIREVIKSLFRLTWRHCSTISRIFYIQEARRKTLMIQKWPQREDYKITRAKIYADFMWEVIFHLQIYITSHLWFLKHSRANEQYPQWFQNA